MNNKSLYAVLFIGIIAVVLAFFAGTHTTPKAQTPAQVEAGAKKDTDKAITDAEKAADAADTAAASARKAADSTKSTAASAEKSASDTADSAKAAEQFADKVK